MKTKTILHCLVAGFIFSACEKPVDEPALTADFTFTPSTAAAPGVISFTSQCKGATSYTWDFDDGMSATEANPVHEFAEAGTYQVTLTAKSNSKFAEITKAVIISVPLPVASFTASADNVPAPAEITFTNTSVNGRTFSWNFGDGTTSSAVSPVHTFNEAGTYTVKLEVTNNSGTSSAQKNLTILAKATVIPGVSIGAYKVNETWGSIAGKIEEENFWHTMLYFSPYYYHLCTFENTGLSFFFQTATSTLVSTATVIYIGAFAPFNAVTDKGIVLGSTTTEVIEEYGQPTKDQYTTLYYNSLGIYFSYDDSMLVDEIDVYQADVRKSASPVQGIVDQLKKMVGLRETLE